MLQNFNIALRDPLGSIFSGISSMARRLEVEDIVSCETLLQQLNQHCYHMLKSCSILSEYTAYSNGLAERNLKLISLNPYLEDLFKHLQMVVRCVGIQLSFHLPSEQIDLNLDPDKLVIVLTCLLSIRLLLPILTQNSKQSTLKSVSANVRFVLWYRIMASASHRMCSLMYLSHTLPAAGKICIFLTLGWD